MNDSKQSVDISSNFLSLLIVWLADNFNCRPLNRPFSPASWPKLMVTFSNDAIFKIHCGAFVSRWGKNHALIIIIKIEAKLALFSLPFLGLLFIGGGIEHGFCCGVLFLCLSSRLCQDVVWILIYLFLLYYLLNHIWRYYANFWLRFRFF